ncbi:MAG: Ig domain-containing protein, partial [Candidatus Bathyarchaeota archaeon]|nr:Ig domain-containing protein [Candidatus Bathyarchaeota archaeon]
YRFTLADTGELLPGSLVLHGNGTITGTPSAENTGKYNLVIRVEDDQGNTATKALELKVAFLGLATADLPVGRLEMEYSNQFKGFRILGGKPPYIFELTQGSLPDGLQLGEDGKISGIPEQKGEFPVSVRVSDSQNNTFGKDYTLKIEDVIDVTLSPGSPMTGVTSGNYITIRIAAKRTGFNDAYDYRLIDAPGWLSLSSNWFGTSITGKPSEPGTYHFKLQVSVSGSPVSMEVPYTIAVDETQTYSSLQITTEQLGEGRVNVPYSQTLSASGGTGTRSFGFTGKGDKLDGLSISADGTITWTPAGQDYGYHTLEIEAKDQEGHIASKRFEIYIRGGITVDPPNGTELPATTNKEFSQRISGSGGTVESYLYVLSNKGDQLPAGLTFNNGLISGTPAPGTAGDYNLVIRASENGGSFSGTEVKYHLKVSE